MSRKRLFLLLVTIVGLAGVGSLSPLVQDVTVSDSGAPWGVGLGPTGDLGGDVTDTAAEGGGGGQPPDEEVPLETTGPIPLLALLGVGVLGAFAVVLYRLSQDIASVPEAARAATTFLLLTVAVGLFLSVIWVLGTDPGPASSPTDPVQTPISNVPEPVFLAGLGALVGIGGVGYLVLRRRGTGEAAQASREPDPTRAVGSAAGRAVARLDDEDLSNVVYRAWQEMTSALSLADPETATPTEFASEAVTQGMDPADVQDLTDLFRAVRYGNRPVTEERAEAARVLLERLEARYADQDEEGDTG